MTKHQSLIDHYVGQYTWPRFKALHLLTDRAVDRRDLNFRVRDWLTNCGLVLEDGQLFRLNDRGRAVYEGMERNRK